MNITGLENGSYYLGNPVKVVVSGLRNGLKLDASYRGKVFTFWYSEINGSVEIDVSKIVSGIIPRLKSIRNISNISQMGVGVRWTVGGSYNVSFSFQDAKRNSLPTFLQVNQGASKPTFPQVNQRLPEPVHVSCQFLIGGKVAYSFNVPTRTNLNVGDTYYEGYPNYYFTYNNGIISGLLLNKSDRSWADIVYTSHLINPIFLIFRNSYGGFSRLLFETYDKSISNRGGGSFVTMDNIGVDKGEVSSSFLCKTQLKRINYEVAHNLVISDEVYIYNKNILDVPDRLIRVDVSSSSDINYADQTTDFNVELSLLHNYD